MSYIGNQPATAFETVQKQISTSNSGTTITLDRAVTSVQDILLTIDAVVQSYDNYSVSGTTLTVGGTLSNNRVEILYVGRTMQSVDPTDDSVSAAKIKTDAVTTAKIQNDAVTKDKVNFATDSTSAGITSLGDGTSSGNSGAIELRCSNNNHGVQLISPDHSASQSWKLKLPDNSPTADKFLKVKSITGSGSTATGQLEFADAGGAFTRVGGASSTSQTTYIDFDNVFTSTYTQYLITVACQFVNNDVHLKLRMRASGSVDSGSGEYGWIVGGRGVSGTSESGIGNGQGHSADDSYQCNQWGASDNNTENIFYQIHVRNPLPSTTSNAEGNNVMFQNTCTLWTSDNYMTIQHGGGRKTGGTDNDGIRLYTTNGDFRTHKVDIYGLQGS